MAYVRQQNSGSEPAEPGRMPPATLLLGVVLLGIAAFGLQAGPVYTGQGASVTGGYLTWPRLAAAALLLAGLLAIPARAVDARQHRTIVAVLSAFGLLVIVMGMMDRPAHTGVGWALVAGSLLAALQAVLAGLALLERRPDPLDSATRVERATDPVAFERFSPAPATQFAVPDPYRPARAAAFGHGEQRGVAHGDAPPGDVFTPPASPAASGAQPSSGASVHTPATTRGDRDRSQPAGTADNQPVRSEWPM